MKLSDHTKGRDNNFNAIRMIAALAVLFTHSFSLAIGSHDAEPTFTMLGSLSPGAIAVDIFFVISGFLVTASLLSSCNIIEFFWARLLRIIPALLVMLFFTTFILGAYLTSLPLITYFTNLTVYIYFVKCLSLFYQIAYYLPGVFETNPYLGAVNGSLWSMKHEVRFYALLAFLWVLSSLIISNRVKLFTGFVIFIMVASVCYLWFRYSIGEEIEVVLKLISLFFIGGVGYILKNYIYLSKKNFLISICILLLSGIYNDRIFFCIYLLIVPYLVLYLAYVPKKFIRKYNLVGDYSYGMYIYSFPIQQAIIFKIPGTSPLQVFLLSFFLTLFCAILSWHVVESRALQLKKYFSNKTKLLLTRIQI